MWKTLRERQAGRIGLAGRLRQTCLANEALVFDPGIRHTVLAECREKLIRSTRERYQDLVLGPPAVSAWNFC